jgi:hypothetical protein
MRSLTSFASFNVSIDGSVARAAYDSQLAESSISLSFCTVNHIYNRFGVCSTTVTVETSTGELFTCAIQLIILNKNPLDHLYDVVLGRDWFSLCSTGLENYPDTAVHLLSLNQWLIFASLSVDAVHAQLLPYSKSLCLLFFFFFF